MAANNDVNLKAIFILDKAENAEFFEQQMHKLLDAHMGWRQNYMPQDMPAIDDSDK